MAEIQILPWLAFLEIKVYNKLYLSLETALLARQESMNVKLCSGHLGKAQDPFILGINIGPLLLASGGTAFTQLSTLDCVVIFLRPISYNCNLEL